MTMNTSIDSNDLAGTTAIVTGASRGFGRAVATALVTSGAHVVGVARTQADLDAVHAALGDGFVGVAADAANPATADRLLEQYNPHTVVLCAGAAPQMSALQDQTWETFSENWNVDVAQAFYWVRRVLQTPLRPRSSVIAFSSGAAIKGSPLSGGYAGANATVRFITSYAAIESQRAGLDVDFVSVLPQLTPSTDLGAKAVAAYAERQGVSVDDFIEGLGPALVPELVGKSVLELVGAERRGHGSYVLSAAGLSEIP
jgi:NAD(P)-dependent dehydrogenase (short-subunit alcohol dehydrogenase family)